MKKTRPPYIDREIYEPFKQRVKKEKDGRVRDTLKEELEKAIIFYDKCGNDLHCKSKEEMIAHLDGVKWKLVVDVDATKNLDIIEEFKKSFKNVFSLKKKTLELFIAEMTGNSGDYTYRKYSKKLIAAGLIEYDSKGKKYFTDNAAMGRVKSKVNNEEPKLKKVNKAKQEADEFFEGLYGL